MRFLLVPLLLVLPACDGCHECVRGHWEQRYYPETTTTTTFMDFGNGVLMPVESTTPAHIEQEYVCDERAVTF